VSALFTRNRLIGLALAALVALVDQAVKWYVIGPLALRQVLHIDLLPFFDLTYTENRGVSLGMFEASNMETRWLLVAVTALIGGLQGSFVAYVGVPSFVVTLAGLLFWQGVILYVIGDAGVIG